MPITEASPVGPQVRFAKTLFTAIAQVRFAKPLLTTIAQVRFANTLPTAIAQVRFAKTSSARGVEDAGRETVEPFGAGGQRRFRIHRKIPRP